MALNKGDFSTKRLAIDKAAAQMVAIVAAASFISVFALVACHTVWKQNLYRAKVIDAKEQARDDLEANLEAVSKLVTAYKAFDKKNPNIIAGQRSGLADNDGTNAKIVLDALPSTYDFPAVTSSVEKLLLSHSFKITNVDGTDEQTSEGDKAASPDPKPVAMPFAFSVSEANYTQIQALMLTLERSIRPIKINSLVLGGAINNMDLSIEAETYYQPSRNLEIKTKVVKD